MSYKNNVWSQKKITTIPANCRKPDQIQFMILSPRCLNQENGELNHGPTYQRNIKYYAAIKEDNCEVLLQLKKLLRV